MWLLFCWCSHLSGLSYFASLCLFPSYSTSFLTWPEISIPNNSLTIIWHRVFSSSSSLSFIFAFILYHPFGLTVWIAFLLCHLVHLQLQSNASINGSMSNLTLFFARCTLFFTQFSSTEPKMSFSVRLNVVGKCLKREREERKVNRKERPVHGLFFVPPEAFFSSHACSY